MSGGSSKKVVDEHTVRMLKGFDMIFKHFGYKDAASIRTAGKQWSHLHAGNVRQAYELMMTIVGLGMPNMIAARLQPQTFHCLRNKRIRFTTHDLTQLEKPANMDKCLLWKAKGSHMSFFIKGFAAVPRNGQVRRENAMIIISSFREVNGQLRTYGVIYIRKKPNAFDYAMHNRHNRYSIFGLYPHSGVLSQGQYHSMDLVARLITTACTIKNNRLPLEIQIEANADRYGNEKLLMKGAITIEFTPDEDAPW